MKKKVSIFASGNFAGDNDFNAMTGLSQHIIK